MKSSVAVFELFQGRMRSSLSDSKEMLMFHYKYRINLGSEVIWMAQNFGLLYGGLSPETNFDFFVWTWDLKHMYSGFWL